MVTPHSRLFFWGVIAFWGAFFFYNWASFSRIKAIEFFSMVGQSREEQLQVLHPTGEMAHLLQLRDTLQEITQQETSLKIGVIAPHRDADLPQGHNASILRAVLYPIPILDNPQLVKEQDLVVVIEASSSAFEPAESWCSTESTDCTCYQEKTQQQEVLCWLMPTP